jgi:hypothetical protein
MVLSAACGRGRRGVVPTVSEFVPMSSARGDGEGYRQGRLDQARLCRPDKPSGTDTFVMALRATTGA